MNHAVAPHLNTNLSKRGWRVTSSSMDVRQLFCNDHVIRLKSLEEIEAALNDARQEYEERRRKVEELTEFLENLEATRLLKNQSHNDFPIHLNKLAAETEVRDRLAWAIRGLERAIDWRKANPLVR